MRYAHFCKICEICCDRKIAINRYPYVVCNSLDAFSTCLTDYNRTTVKYNKANYIIHIN